MEPHCGTRHGTSDLNHWKVLKLVTSQSDGKTLMSQQQIKSNNLIFTFLRKVNIGQRKEETKELLEIKILHEVLISGCFRLPKVIQKPDGKVGTTFPVVRVRVGARVCVGSPPLQIRKTTHASNSRALTL